MISKKIGKVIVAVALILMIATLVVFAGGQKKEPVVTAPKKESETKALPEAAEPETVTIIDAIGREVTIKKPIERIAFTHPTTGEMIKVVGAWDRVVAIDYNARNELLFPGANELPLVDGPMCIYDLNFEEMFEAHPDILLTVRVPMPGFEDMLAKLEPEIPVVVVGNPNAPEAWTDGVTLLGSILDQEEEAGEFIAWYEEVEADIRGRTAGLSEEEKPRVFFKVPGMSAEQLCTFTNELGFVERLFEVTGAINIAADLPSTGGWVQNVDPEWILEQNPEVIMVQIWEMYHQGVFGFEVDDPSVAEAARNESMNMVVFADSHAAANGEVYLYESMFTVSPRLVVLMAYWARWLHPELFADLDPQAIYQEYLTMFMRIDYDLEKHGVFVYPEP
jgi:iron complex transport system substrate-binding protein